MPHRHTMITATGATFMGVTGLQTLYFLGASQRALKIGATMFTMSWVGKLRHREVKKGALSHQASRWHRIEQP